jgi:hypothetical protein
VLARLRQRGRFTQAELAQLRKHILSRESSYIPRARTAYLASLSLNHAAEEAAHFIRHCAVGDALVGYLPGEGLYRAFDAGQVDRADPRGATFAWVERLRG